jgi:glycosyltransferase involved in cell wall biosynthesis
MERSFQQRASYSSWLRPLMAREAKAFSRLSAEYLRIVDGIVVSAERELEAYPSAMTVLNGADPRMVRRPPSRFDVAFTGNLSYGPNADAVVELCSVVVPILRRHRPTARVVVAGRRPSSRIRALCREANVTLIEDADSISDLLAESRVAVAPVRRATGGQLKVVEALAAGTPMVAYAPAAAGLAAVSGITVCRDADDLVRAVVDLLNGPDKAVMLPHELTWEAQSRLFEDALQSVYYLPRSSRPLEVFTGPADTRTSDDAPGA